MSFWGFLKGVFIGLISLVDPFLGFISNVVDCVINGEFSISLITGLVYPNNSYRSIVVGGLVDYSIDSVIATLLPNQYDQENRAIWVTCSVCGKETNQFSEIGNQVMCPRCYANYVKENTGKNRIVVSENNLANILRVREDYISLQKQVLDFEKRYGRKPHLANQQNRIINTVVRRGITGNVIKRNFNRVTIENPIIKQGRNEDV